MTKNSIIKVDDKHVAITTYLAVVSSSPPTRLSNDFVFLSALFVIDHFVCNHDNIYTLHHIIANQILR